MARDEVGETLDANAPWLNSNPAALNQQHGQMHTVKCAI